MIETTVHLLRHGEVDNPDSVLYGRLPEFHLSELGHEMAQLVYDDFFANRDIKYLASSPLERTQETATPAAKGLGLEIHEDERLIEGRNEFEGQKVNKKTFTKRKNLRYLRNPFKPSWGESYKEIVTRMQTAIEEAAQKAEGHEALLVSHQLPIWMARQSAEGKHLIHNPKNRQCTLASVTSFTFENGKITKVEYCEPAQKLLAHAKTLPGA
ncbi:MAG: histidine phosphatase family protein [Micrococcaceae bacterium]